MRFAKETGKILDWTDPGFRVRGCSEHDNEPSCSTKGEFIMSSCDLVEFLR